MSHGHNDQRFRRWGNISAAFAVPNFALFAGLWCSGAAVDRVQHLPPLPRPQFAAVVQEGSRPGCQLTATVEDTDKFNARLVRAGTSGAQEVWRAVPHTGGAVRFSGLPNGTYHLTTHGQDTLAVAPTFVCRDEERAHFHLTPVRGGVKLHGTIRDGDGQLVKGAEVTIAQEADERSAIAGVLRIEARDGTYDLSLPPGRYVLRAFAPLHRGNPQRVEVSGQIVHADVLLDPAPDVRGRVVDSDGNPVVHAQVTLVAAGESADPKKRPATAMTDDHGRFVVPARLLSEATLHVQHPRAGAGSVDLGVVADVFGRSDVEVALHHGFSVTGLVSTVAGEPWSYGVVRYRIVNKGLTGLASVDAVGRFAISGIDNADEVQVWAEGNATGAWGAAVATSLAPEVALTYVAPAYAQAD